MCKSDEYRENKKKVEQEMGVRGRNGRRKRLRSLIRVVKIGFLEKKRTEQRLKGVSRVDKLQKAFQTEGR